MADDAFLRAPAANGLGEIYPSRCRDREVRAAKLMGFSDQSRFPEAAGR